MIERLLRASVEDAAPTERRRFARTGALLAEPDLAERSEALLRSDEDPDAAGGRRPERAILTEVCLLLERRRGTRAELAFLADVRAGRFTLVDDLEPDLDRIAELVQRYADTPRSSRSPSGSS